MAAKLSSRPPSQDETSKLIAWAKENNAKLESCTLHNFETVESALMQRRCLNCGGFVGGSFAGAYNLGVTHANASKGER